MITLLTIKVPMVSFNGAEDKTGVSNLLASAGTSNVRCNVKWEATGSVLVKVGQGAQTRW
jgi:hypothetical protein